MQLEELTEKIFASHLGTIFYIPFDERRVEMELVEVAGADSGLQKIEGVERFSIYFLGPEDIHIRQHTYRMEHDALGQLDIFIVPVSVENRRVRYEAVFSRLTG